LKTSCWKGEACTPLVCEGKIAKRDPKSNRGKEKEKKQRWIKGKNVALIPVTWQLKGRGEQILLSFLKGSWGRGLPQWRGDKKRTSVFQKKERASDLGRGSKEGKKKNGSRRFYESKGNRGAQGVFPFRS